MQKDAYVFSVEQQPEALSWTSVNAGGHVPVGRAEHTAVDYQQGMWVFGGWGPGVGVLTYG